MTGTRNHRDGLYDIPLEKTSIQQNNFIMPPLHPIYKISNVRNEEFTKNQCNQISFTPKLKQTINNMNLKNFNNILQPVISNNTKDYVPVDLGSGKINVILRKDKTKDDLVSFLHGAVCFPTSPTWIKAIKINHFTTWPGLTADLLTKHLPPSVATAESHIKQEQQNLMSTKPKQPKQNKKIDHDNLIDNYLNN